MAAEVIVTDTTGASQPVMLDPQATLMEALRDRGMVLGTCGGMCSCGTCHVYVDAAADLPPPGEDEADMLEALADVVEIRPSSRLSCQIRATDLGDAARVTIAPQL